MQSPTRKSDGNGRRMVRYNTDGGAHVKLPSVGGAFPMNGMKSVLRSPGTLGKSMLDKLVGGGDSRSGSKASVATTSPSSPGSAVSVSSPKPLSLAARRTRVIDSIEIGLMDQRQVEEKRVDSKQGLKRIQKVKTVTELYSFGDQVMPSCHRGMEIIFATCKKTGNDVIIKVRRKDKSFSSSSSEQDWRMSTEFVLNMPVYEGVAAIYEVLEDDEAYCVVMEKVPGRDLFEALCANEVCDLAEVKEIMRQLLSALDVMHQRGAIHRDLKLENVMFMKINDELLPCSRDDEEPASPVVVKLIDFDTAENWEPDSPKAKTVLGTDQYISSEAYAGKYSPASDIFAVGVIAYKLLTGRFPFDSRMFDDEAGENWVGSPKMRQIQDRVQRFNINWNCFPFKTHPEAYELMRVMLAPLETDRPEASEALKHPFLADCISPTSASSRQKLSDCVSPTSSSSRQRPTSSGVGSSAGSPKQPK
mmetsp:Transcript_71182/g.153488  ORF Transcript_71182/g.153488 Transcript_71182/m.153488 type:complete len:475 (+) Transcript_71182:51-1475(+)